MTTEVKDLTGLRDAGRITTRQRDAARALGEPRDVRVSPLSGLLYVTTVCRRFGRRRHTIGRKGEVETRRLK